MVAHAVSPVDLSVNHAPVTELLYRRVEESDLAELERRIADDDSTVDARLAPGLPPEPKPIREVWAEQESELERKRLALALGVHYGVPGILERTGLTGAAPPDEVHLMGRGPLGAGGSTYHADLVVDALASAGVELEAGMRGLDFGCSSGRVVRVLAAAYPDVSVGRLRPDRVVNRLGAREPAGNRLRGQPGRAAASVRGRVVRLRLRNLDLVALLRGRRVAVVGRAASGDSSGRPPRADDSWLPTIAHYRRYGIPTGSKRRPAPELIAIRDALDSTGFCFVPVFGEEGDWGLVNPEWGMAYMTPDWLEEQVRPKWRVAQFAAGRNEGDQDVFVLARA